MTVVVSIPTDLSVHNQMSGMRLGGKEIVSPLSNFFDVKEKKDIEAIYGNDSVTVNIVNPRYFVVWHVDIPVEIRSHLTFRSLVGFSGDQYSTIAHNLMNFRVIFDGPEDLAVVWRLMV